MNGLTAADVHASVHWPTVLEQLGIGAEYLKPRHGPCPACGGKDRFRFDNKHGRGTFYCNGCGAGDGFGLLQRVHRWDFREALHQVADVAGLSRIELTRIELPSSRKPSSEAPATPTRRVQELVRGTTAPDTVEDAIQYLRARRVWPLPSGCSLRAHASVPYYDDKLIIGNYAALVAEVRDVAGELVTAHVTYLSAGEKLSTHEPRKILSPMTGRDGCAVRLVAASELLGIAEGIETALSAMALREVPTWAALNASLLAKFEPPAAVRELVIFADRDVAGLEATCRLMERLQGRIHVSLQLPKAGFGDFNDELRGAP